jgi:hypothetical protein
MWRELLGYPMAGERGFGLGRFLLVLGDLLRKLDGLREDRSRVFHAT